MNHFQTYMHENLIIAIKAFQTLSKESRQVAEKHVNEIISLKHQMESIANQKGYSIRCKTAIPICKGECCKWQFPKNLTHVDFFITIFNMPKEEQDALSKIILLTNNTYCPILLKNGCSLSFEQRPVICTNAYPCFNNRSYWNEKEAKIILFKKEFDSLEGLLPQNSSTIQMKAGKDSFF